MSETIISRRNDRSGRKRYYVLPIESRESFVDLLKFVSQEFNCEFSEIDDGPGVTVQRGTVENVKMVFVLSDTTGGQFYPEMTTGSHIAESIANSIEARFKEIKL